MEKYVNTPKINIEGRFVEVILPLGIDERSTKRVYLAICNMKKNGVADAEIIERVRGVSIMAVVIKSLKGFGSPTIEIVENQIKIRATKPYSEKEMCEHCKKRMYSQRGAARALANALQSNSIKTPKRMYFCDKSSSYHLTSKLV